ncbi:MAG: hypothetical protein RXP30_01120 [Thermoplasmata archaeon]|nr:hypothetical protein [Euryarchaeota archaeon]
MKNFPFVALKYALPLIFVLAIFSFFSGSTLYFFISFIFMLILLIVVYPFYVESFQEQENVELIRNYEGEQEWLDKKFEEALNGNAVAQRLIEERIFRIATYEIRDRTGKNIGEIIDSLEKGEIDMEKDALEVLVKFLKRRNSLELSISKEEFEKEINTVIDALGG